jgi:uncharacterized protein with FMN-binding domain
MKKFLASFIFIVGFIGYAVYANSSASSANAQTVTVSNPSASTAADTTASVPTQTSAGSAPPTQSVTPVTVVKKPAAAAGKYTDGTYTGIAADAYYGNIQVKATISGGKLTDVAFLQYPSDRNTSVYINQQAMPVLRSEAIQAQSANVNGVSGASDSSAAFKQSLASALAKA